MKVYRIKREKYSRQLTGDWAESNVLLCLLVPSRIVPTEYNILINPNHEDFDKVIIADERDFRFDKRLRS